MAKGKKTGGRNFEPGDTRAGRPALPEEVKRAANLTKAECVAKLSEFLKLSTIEIEAVLRDRSRPAMDLWVARIVALGIKNGDHARLNFMFDRLIGKVTDKIEHSQATPVMIEFSNGDKTLLGSKDKDDG